MKLRYLLKYIKDYVRLGFSSDGNTKLSKLILKKIKKGIYLDIGCYPFYFGGRPGSNFVLRGPSKFRIDEAAGQLRGIIIKLGGDPIDGGVEVPVDKSD